MTLIIGIKCTDGVVLGADGAATFGAIGQPTIRQPVGNKLSIIDNQVVIGVSGPVGLGQRFCGVLTKLWSDKTFSKDGKANKQYLAMDVIRRHFLGPIEIEMKAAQIVSSVVGSVAAQSALSATMVAIPVGRDLCLFQFDQQGAPEHATEDLPFVAIAAC